MIDLRYGLAGLALFLAVFVAVTNWCRLLRSRGPSHGRDGGTVPLVSIGLTAVAAYLHPGPDKKWMLFVPLADIATWLVVILPFWLMLKAFFPGKRAARLSGRTPSMGEEKP